MLSRIVKTLVTRSNLSSRSSFASKSNSGKLLWSSKHSFSTERTTESPQPLSQANPSFTNPDRTEPKPRFNHDNSHHSRETFGKRDLYGIYFLFLASGLTAYLCFWQIRRYFWKREMIDHRSKQVGSEPSTLQDSLSRAMQVLSGKLGGMQAAFNKNFVKDFKETTEYMPVKLRGRYRYDQETLVGYASAPMDVVNTKRRETQRGFYILTPFELEEPVVVKTPSKDHGHDVEIVVKTVYINRGWIISSVSKSYLAHPVYERSLHTSKKGKRGPDVGEITEVDGILWYGNRSPDDHANTITSVARDGKSRTYQHMHLDVMAGQLEQEFSIYRAGENEYEGPTMVVDAHTKPPTRRVKALDIEIAENVDTIAISLLRKTIDDYIEFYTTPYNHIVYAVTWGTFCLFSSYLLGARYLFRETNIKKWFATKAKPRSPHK